MSLLPFQSLCEDSTQDAIEVVCTSIEVLVFFLCSVKCRGCYPRNRANLFRYDEPFRVTDRCLMSSVDGAVFISYKREFLDLRRLNNLEIITTRKASPPRFEPRSSRSKGECSNRYASRPRHSLIIFTLKYFICPLLLPSFSNEQN